MEPRMLTRRDMLEKRKYTTKEYRDLICILLDDLDDYEHATKMKVGAEMASIIWNQAQALSQTRRRKR